jgi:hypothetical protein
MTSLRDINIVSPIDDANGGVEVSRQDQTSEPIDAYFQQEISSFTLAIDTVASTQTTLVYTFTATSGHGIAPLDEILLLDIVGDRALQCRVITVATDLITIDRPIDNIYPAATSLGRIATSNMAVNGAITPQIFTFRAGTAPVDACRVLLTMLGDTTTPNDGLFGNITALTRGLVFRIYNGLHKTTFCFKTNLEIKQFCYDVDYADAPPTGQSGVSARISFGGEDKHGVVLRVSGNSVLQWVVQDDLTGMNEIRASVEGHKVVL